MRTITIHGLEVSTIGVGTWQFGSREWGYGDDYARREARAIVRRAVELGITLFDTAEAYAWGASERILGDALGDDRADVVVATKLLPAVPVGPVIRNRGRASARRLGLDRIPLYQVHWPNPVVPLSYTMHGLRDLQDEGVIAQVGVSNFDLRQWRTAERLLGRPVVSNQVEYSLLSREPERDLIGHAEQHGRMIVAYSPLAQGAVTGKYDVDHLPGGLRGAVNPAFRPDNMRRLQPLIDVLREVAAAHDATPAQIALAWTIRSPAVVAIPGASSVAQVESNAAAADLDLADDEIAALSDASERYAPSPVSPSDLARSAGRAVLDRASGLLHR